MFERAKPTVKTAMTLWRASEVSEEGEGRAKVDALVVVPTLHVQIDLENQVEEKGIGQLRIGGSGEGESRTHSHSGDATMRKEAEESVSSCTSRTRGRKAGGLGIVDCIRPRASVSGVLEDQRREGNAQLTLSRSTVERGGAKWRTSVA
jgi:hypothetical protein